MPLPPKDSAEEPKMSAREALKNTEVRQMMGKGFGISLQLSSQMAATLLLAGAIGFGLDRWFDSLPLFSIIFFFLGAGLACFNVIKALQQQMAMMDAAETDAPKTVDGHPRGQAVNDQREQD
ncbi:MAG: AtpZ/AtpI family protein [Rhodospirillaceae bacterium]|jgi:F0F1-type ATP synthase assembly protein I|nr:AtpZ/AtpI family protein [Rhodospirillaceae bacterium]